MRTSVKMIKFDCKHDLHPFFLDEWRKIKKFSSFKFCRNCTPVNGIKLSSFGLFQFFNKIAYLCVSRNLENGLILKFVIVDFKAANVCQYNQIRFQT